MNNNQKKVKINKNYLKDNYYKNSYTTIKNNNNENIKNNENDDYKNEKNKNKNKTFLIIMKNSKIKLVEKIII